MPKKPAGSTSRRPTSRHKPTTSKVRIVGGQFKRRQLAFIDADGLRPTPDRLRETLFNWLMADVLDATVLDCCAGSGVLGFEAISRGAAHCTFIEANPQQSQQLHESAEQLQLDQSTVQIFTGRAELLIEQQAATWLPFNIIFLDPPYDLDLWLPILSRLVKFQLITSQTLIYIEADRPIEEIVAPPDLKAAALAFECLKQTKVGQIFAGIYQLAVDD